MRWVTEPSENEWERTYQASVEAERQAGLRAAELHERAMAMMPPTERRRRRRTLLIILLPMGALLLAGIIVDGVASHAVVSGDAREGTAVLTRQVEVCVGRPPCFLMWEARFSSDDGTIDRTVVFDEDVPAADAQSGARVAARWTSVKPDKVYLAESRAFRNWFWTSIMVLVVCLVAAGIAFSVWHRRRQLRRKIESEGAPTTATKGPPTP